MEATFTKEEIKKLIDVLRWVNTATQDTKESRQQLQDISTKLRIIFKSLHHDEQVMFKTGGLV